LNLKRPNFPYRFSVYHFRRFLNTDLHRVVHLWRSCGQGPQILEPMSAHLIEELILSKSFFDAEGFVIAEIEKEMIGAFLVGFAPNESGSDLDWGHAILSRAMVDPRHENNEVFDGILAMAETYASSKGAKTIHYGSKFPYAPFLQGAYGGVLVPGVLEQEDFLKTALEKNDFGSQGTIECFDRGLSDFRPVVESKQMMARRQFNVKIQADPPPHNWYNAICFGTQNCVDFSLIDRKNSGVCGNLSFWEVQPLGAARGRRTAGLYRMEIDETVRKNGLATLLLGEAFRQLQELGFVAIETQVPSENEIVCRLFEKLGFNKIGVGQTFSKSLAH